ncbi:MAG: Crp/Fnr family transcriptional regulator [Wenzhouxiangella sp.]|nr:Crp/Fnr family transcriptional regulator [Wenzhouxiangella sp.]
MTSPIRLTDSQARAFLATSPWIRGFPEDLREVFLARCRLLPPFDRGQRIYNVGDQPDGIYGVVSGAIGFEIGGDEEGPQMVQQVWPGDWFGELAHVLDCPRLAALEASRPSQCMRISATDLTQLLEQYPLLWKQLARQLAQVSLVAMTGVHDLMERSPRRRLVATLLRVAGIRNGEDIERIDLAIDLTHGGLASLSNLSRSLVGETLLEMEQAGFVQCSYGKIMLLDPAGLRDWLKSSAGKPPRAQRFDSRRKNETTS